MNNDQETNRKDTPWRDNSIFVTTFYAILTALVGAVLALAIGDMTLPSECVSLNRPGFENHPHPRGRRGGGNVGIGFIDFQGLWEGRKTAPSFSGLSINRHFLCLP